MTTTTTNGRTQLVPHTPAQPGRIGQATAVEQSRAVAEVQAAIVVAQQVPRDITRAQRAMRQSCGQKGLAERAFFSYPRAGETITGPSVQLARELARCWGNIQYGLTELRRDDGYAQSEMQAWAWDVETNARTSTTFIVPHARDTRQGVKALTDMRDIYENNANNGARRLREMIFAILPAWYTEEAVAECYETLADAGGVPMEQRVASAITNYAALKVTQADLERKVGAPAKAWSAYDVAHLGVIYRSILRGETRKEDEFDAPQSQPRVTAADITSPPEPPAAPPAPPAPPAPAAPAAEPTRPTDEAAALEASLRAATRPAASSPQPATKGPALKLDRLLQSLQLGPEEDVRALLEHLCGQPYTATRSQVQLVTGILEDHLQACQGDTAEAASAVWARYRAATGQAAAEGSQEAASDG